MKCIRTSMEYIAIIFLLSSLLSIQKICTSVPVDTITANHFITENDSLVSSGGSFELGIFKPGSSSNSYVGIWYKKITVKTVVWVANRQIPLTKGGVLKVINPGILILLNATNNVIWSSNTSRSYAKNPIVQLLDSGNLVVRDANDDNPENFLWQSFDYPTDTQLPGMKLGKNFVTGQEWYLSSWKNKDDPAPGDFTYHLDPSGYPQIILKRGLIEEYRTGPWNGLRFSGRPSLTQKTMYTHGLVFTKDEVYYSFELLNSSVVSRFILNQSDAQRWTWVDRTRGWVLYLNAPTDNCDDYARCGPNGVCNISNSPVCGCLNKFISKNQEDWTRDDWSDGCIRNTSLNCRDDGFLMYSHVKLPDTRDSWYNERMNLKECEKMCLKNCNCTAYANLDIKEGGSGCLLWFNDLIDIRELPEAGQDIYVRMAYSELAPQSGSDKEGKIIKVVLPLLVGMVLLGLSLTVYSQKKKRLLLKREGRLAHGGQDYSTNKSKEEDVELPLFGLSTIANATNNFSNSNKLGEGGFGPVYKNTSTDMILMRRNKTPMEVFTIMFLLFSLLSMKKISYAVAADTITETQFLKDEETIISSGGSFEMGFFSPSNSNNRYVGIWYKKISVKTVVWVANREIPLTNTSKGMLKVIKPGILVLVNANNNIIWSSNTSRPSAKNHVAQLLDCGNLIVREANDDNPENFLWQSFDYPTDTQLPGMKLGKNFVTGVDRYLSSWKSNDDPAPGNFTYHCDPSGYPQNILKESSTELYRSGPWNGLRFSGSPSILQSAIYEPGVIFNHEEVYYSYKLLNSSVVSRFMLNPSGVGHRWTWSGRTHNWVRYLSVPIDYCDHYALCGPNGICNIANTPVCECLQRFVAKHPENWGTGDWSSGCVRNRTLDCKNRDGFLKHSNIKLPDTRRSWFNKSMTLEKCRLVCLKNCSCTAYANLDIRGGGSGCLLWFDDLIDIRELPKAGQDIYVRMASSDSESVSQSSSNRKKGEIIKVILPLLAGMVLLGMGLTLYARKKKARPQLKREWRFEQDPQDYSTNKRREEDVELPLFGLSVIANATNNFSIKNKLGEGGFGPVYKGVLEEGRDIAVKRLSKTSKQGLNEFKNEVICIAKLQHRNLVKLLGYCIHGDEMMLIYEYMPNKSLDSFIFDETANKLLDWPKRFHIINGIARGLLYLHEDSRLRIIHRDLKASNVLLDFDMNPKISDFGMARSFGGDETGANTNRVVGTFGYMSPEYATDGVFSVKSDVFSFGVLVLEIVSGKRNRGFFHPDHHHNLLGHAWRLHREGRSLELMDAPVAVEDSCYQCEVLRSIQVGLLCVQQCPEDRPSMSFVVLMLGSEGALPWPNQPGFFTERSLFEAECSSNSYTPSLNNEITTSLFDGR